MTGGMVVDAEQPQFAPIISVIMPCFNAARHVRRSLASLRGQTFTRWRAIVVDDGSTDDTSQVVSAIGDPRVQLIRQANAGVSAARNRALQEVRTPFVAFLDSDDTWAPDFLQVMVDALVRAPDAAVAYCGWQDVHPPPRRNMVHEPPDYEALPDKLAALLERCPWVIHAAVARIDAVRGAGGFDTRFKVGEDYLMWMRIAARHRVVRVAGTHAYYHHGDDRTQATANVIRVVRQTRAVREVFLAEQPGLRARLGSRRVRELLCRQALQCGYDAFWRRDLEGAQTLFRDCLRGRYLRLRDAKYVVSAALPLAAFVTLVRLLERR